MIKTRVIKTGGWYYPQVKDENEAVWYFLDGEGCSWKKPYDVCNHWSIWGAKHTLTKYLARTKVEVVYEADG